MLLLLGRCGLLDERVVGVAVPHDVHVPQLRVPGGGRVGVPQGDGGEVPHEDGLGFAVVLLRFGDGGGGGRLGDELVELGGVVVAVVGGGTRHIEGFEEVVDGGVVAHPAGAEGYLDGALGDLVAELLEGGVGLAVGGDAEGLVEVVADGVDPLLVAAVSVVADLEGATPLTDVIGLLPQFAGLGGVVGEDAVAGHIEVHVAQGGGGEFFGGGAGAEEDFLRDERPVDGHGDGGAAQSAFLAFEVGEPFGDDEGGGACRGLVAVAVGEVRLEVGEGGGADGTADGVEEAAEEVGVGGVGAGVEDPPDALVVGLRVALEAGVGFRHEAVVVEPGLAVRQLVGAVADGVFTVGFHVFEGDTGERHVGGVAEAQGEASFGLVEGDGEAQRAGDLEAAHVAVGVVGRGDLVIAFDGAEEALVELEVFAAGAVVPGVHIALCGDGFAVAEGPAGLQGDGELGGVAVGFDGLGVGHLHLAVIVVLDEAGEEVAEDVAAAHLVGVGGDEGVLGFGPVDAEHAGRGGVASAAAAGEGGQAAHHEECAGAGDEGAGESAGTVSRGGRRGGGGGGGGVVHSQGPYRWVTVVGCHSRGDGGGPGGASAPGGRWLVSRAVTPAGD